MTEKIKSLLKNYKDIRGRTIKFLESVPEDKWTWSPGELLGTFGMQIRHMANSENCYIEGIKKKKIDFEQKTFGKELEEDKRKAVEKLKELDDELLKAIESFNPEEKITFVDGVSGTSEEEIEDIINYLIEHEFYHQGIFTCYGRLAGMGKFLFM